MSTAPRPILSTSNNLLSILDIEPYEAYREKLYSMVNSGSGTGAIHPHGRHTQQNQAIYYDSTRLV